MSSNTAYDNILEYSSQKQFGEFRRVLIGNRGSIASGNLAQGLTLVFDKNKSTENEELFEDETPKMPINIVQKVGSYGQPGLIFNRQGYEEAIKQVESRGELALESLIDKLKFSKDSDEKIWEDVNSTVKKRCVSRNLDKLLKETATQYRTYGDRMHYLTVGLIEAEDYQGKVLRYPLFLFSCTELDINRFKATIDMSGFINFWLDKNIFNGEIGRKRGNNFEVTLDNDFASTVNTVSEYMNSINLSAQFKSIKVDPSYIAFQIISGFEAEYVDPAWNKMLDDGEAA